jgi:hypothetical protein
MDLLNNFKWKKFFIFFLAVYLVSQMVGSFITVAYGKAFSRADLGSWGIRRMSHGCVGLTMPPIILYIGVLSQFIPDTVICIGKDVWYGE